MCVNGSLSKEMNTVRMSVPNLPNKGSLMTTVTTSKQAHPSTHNEQILVVKRSYLFPDGTWNGLENVDMQEYLHIIKMHQEFQPRIAMEDDPRYKQIIPYLVFTHNDNYFLMQRKAQSSEQRLKSKFTVGIGGHIRKEDMSEGSIFDWAKREFHEEVNYSGSFSIQPLGILNDESNAVGQVHTGFVFLLKGDSPNISVKSELKSGILASFAECLAHKKSMETWSQIVLEHLNQ